MLASVMSTCDAQMIMASALVVENLYRPLRSTPKPDSHYTLMGRIASVVVVAGSIVFALRFESVVTGLTIFWKVAAMMGVVAWTGLFWRKATVAGAWAGTLVGFFTWLFTEGIPIGNYTWDFNATLAHHLPTFMLSADKLSLPWQMIFYLGTSFIATVTVSLFTKPVDKEKLDRFYACIRTPVKAGEPETTPFTLPPGIAPAPRRVFIKHPDFEIPIPGKTTIIGFSAISLIVVLMVLAACWLFGLGQ